MEQKKLILVLGGAGLVLLLAFAALILLGLRYLRGREVPTPVKVDTITLCDLDASGLCVVSFGADNLNQMVINFELPRASYPAFYARVEYGGSSGDYSCQVVKEIPTSVYCSGPRTPLGDPIMIRVFKTEDDTLLAEGSFVVSAIALPTLPGPNLTAEAGDLTPSPAATLPPFAPTEARTPTPTPTRTPTPTPLPGYPN